MLEGLIEALSELEKAFRAKEAEFNDVLRLGRTCLQDAQPMTLGQAFGGYASLTRRLASKLQARRDDLRKLPLGGTAIGTGLGAPVDYREVAIRHLSEITGTTWQPADNAFDAMQNVDAFGRLSGELKTCAMSLGKIGSDFILLSSGPAGGLGELLLPALQAGSSIMPGKVNPVQPMALCQVGFAVAGHDTSISIAVQQGQLEINHYEPLISAYLFSAIRMMTNEIRLFARKCVTETRVDEERALHNLVNSSAVATAIVPILGYDTVAGLVRQGLRERRTFLEIAEEAGHMSKDQAMELIRTVVKS
jgi:aspartate ammonia-lyase